jgi:hypothetical protein
MKTPKRLSLQCVAISLALCASEAALAQNQTQTQNPSQVEKQRQQAEQKVRPEVEQQRRRAQQKAEGNLDQEAIAAIQETSNAIKAIADNKTDQALAAIERAAGKINILTARNPAEALIPVSVEVDAIDSAPTDISEIKKRAAAAEVAMVNRDYPTARVFLDGLTSEIRVRTSHLPLATYPDALRDAARLLDEKKTKEAAETLLTALNTLVIVDEVTPLPVAVAQTAINDAQELRDKDKAKAQQLLATAKQELERAKELGYAGKDPEYASLNKSISDLEKELNGSSDTGPAFSRLVDKVTAFFHRQSGSKKPA